MSRWTKQADGEAEEAFWDQQVRAAVDSIGFSADTLTRCGQEYAEVASELAVMKTRVLSILQGDKQASQEAFIFDDRPEKLI